MRERRPPAKSRSIGFRVEGDLQGTNADRILKAAVDKEVVTEFYVGRQFTWFNGPPGEPLRKLRQRLEALKS